MNDEMNPTEYLLLFKSTDWSHNLSLEEMQQIMEKTYAWFDGLKADGKFKAAQPLFSEGRMVSGRNGASVTDGPFAETKEAIGGYLIITVDSMEEAVQIARGWPLLECGSTLEVRPIAPECPEFYKLRKSLVLATA
ncbi:MAG: YciI family protein [Verrucomicrobiales bacterium]